MRNRDPDPRPRERRRASRAWEVIALLALWRAGGLRARAARRRAAESGADPTRREVRAPLWAQRLVSLLLALAGIAALAFAALFILHPATQLLGISLGAALACAALALALSGRLLVPLQTSVEPRPRLPAREQVEGVVERVRGGAEGITRRRLLRSAAGAAGAGLAAAAAVPLAALGPGLEEQLRRTPWRAGRALVDDQGDGIRADSIAVGSFLTAFAQGASKDDLGAALAVVRVDPSTLRLPPRRAGWAPEGILAYSKICTHAACAISLFRSPLSPSTESRGPALVCPCHYSTFDVLDGGAVRFGPAGRPLPQLPLRIDASGMLRAGGAMSGPVGPSWWGDER